MSNTQQLPVLEKTSVRLGYMRLTDSAPLIMAKELGFYAENGLEVSLEREVSWANLRDKLVMGELDAAQMLAPLPMMTTYGAGGIRANLLTGLSLSLNGNAITLSSQVYRDSGIEADPQPHNPRLNAERFARYLRQRGDRQVVTLATVHLFSTHTFLLRTWLRAGGLNPDRDLRIIVLPPEQMCDSLARGVIDGYCVGEPWNTTAVLQGIGSVAASGYSVWHNAPEKVLCVTDNWHHAYPGTHARLRRALMQACAALVDQERRREAAELLSQSEYLQVPQAHLLPSLTGNFLFSKSREPEYCRNFHVFWEYQACFPWRSHAQLLLQMSADTLGKSFSAESESNLIQQCYRTDLYRESASLLGLKVPDADQKPENSHDVEWQLDDGIVMGADRILAPAEA